MALAAPVLEQTYRYPFPSGLVGEGDRRRLRLATSGGPAANPQFFRGRLLLPVVAADLLLTLGDVARSRFHVPPQMLKRILELADPVATCADDRLRFEAFSACCSVYGRVDLLPEAYDGETLGRGTTNVDFGPGIRAALAGVQDAERARPRRRCVGRRGRGGRWRPPSSDGSRCRRAGCAGSWRSRRSRRSWRSAAELDASGARAFLRSIPKIAVETTGLARARRSGPADPPPRPGSRCRRPGRPGPSSPVRPGRSPRDGAPGLRRGRGRQHRLAARRARRSADARPESRGLARLLRGGSGPASPGGRCAGSERRGGPRGARLGAAAGRRTPSRPRPAGRANEVVGALAALALSGIVGYDLAEAASSGASCRSTSVASSGSSHDFATRGGWSSGGPSGSTRRRGPGLAAWVAGAGGVEYRVRSTRTAGRCTCPWYGRHRGDRGPCKHVLAVQLVAADDARLRRSGRPRRG